MVPPTWSEYYLPRSLYPMDEPVISTESTSPELMTRREFVTRGKGRWSDVGRASFWVLFCVTGATSQITVLGFCLYLMGFI